LLLKMQEEEARGQGRTEINAAHLRTPSSFPNNPAPLARMPWLSTCGDLLPLQGEINALGAHHGSNRFICKYRGPCQPILKRGLSRASGKGLGFQDWSQ
jgi:hypothetical protein